MPRSGSIDRNGPIGMNCDAATAITKAIVAPIIAMTRPCIAALATSWPRVNPIAVRRSRSSRNGRVLRVTACPTTASAANAASTANIQSAKTNGRTDRRTRAVVSAGSWKTMFSGRLLTLTSTNR